MSPLACRINGVDGTQIDVSDRGCQYGDGLFETIAVKQGKAEFLDEHLQRLAEGARRLAISCPSSQQWQADIDALIKGQNQAVLKLILTRGQGGRGYASPEEPEVTRIAMLYPWPGYPSQNREQGVNVRFCATPIAIQPVLAGLKHLNRLEQVLARNEWRDNSITEGLMQDIHGRVIEGTMSNLFLIKDDALHTPDLSGCGVNGIIRQQVIKLAKERQILTVTGEYRREDVESADGLFLTNSLMGIWPVRQVEGTSFGIPLIIRQLQEALDSVRLQ